MLCSGALRQTSALLARRYKLQPSALAAATNLLPSSSRRSLFHVRPALVVNKISTQYNISSCRFLGTDQDFKRAPDVDPGRYRVATVPNALCVLRMLLTPCIGVAVVEGAATPAFTMFVVAGFTDLLDGQIARRVPGQQSLLGSVLDPIADKLLVSTLFVTLSYTSQLPLLLTILVLTRDVCLVVGGFVKRYYQLTPPITLSRYFDPAVDSMRVVPTLMSKANTMLQLTVVAFALSLPVLEFGSQGDIALDALCWITAGTTLWSGLQYATGKAFQSVT